MDITPLMRPELKIIQSYGAGFFRVNGLIFKCPVLVCGDSVEEWTGGTFPFEDTSQLATLSGESDFLLVGCGGGGYKPVPPSYKKSLMSSIGMMVDVMDTPSACRTYNVLTAEGRRVSAALIPVFHAGG